MGIDLKQLLDLARADLRKGTERGRLVRSAAGTAALKLGATFLAFCASLLYARALGPHDYGLYAYVIAWSGLLTVPASLGLPLYLLRQSATAPQGIIALRRWADAYTVASGALCAALLLAAAYLTHAAALRWLFVISSPLPLLTNLTAVRASLLQARGWITRSQWPQLLLAPGAMLVLLAGLWLWRGQLRPLQLISASLLASLLPLLVTSAQLRLVAKAEAATGAARRSLKAALPFMWLGSVYLLVSRTDLIMLGAMRSAHDAGVYAIATRMADFVAFFMLAANAAIAPKIAHLHGTGQTELLQRMLTATSRRVLLLTTPVALVFIVGAVPLLALLFGGDYATGANALRILSLAQLAYVAGGPLGYVLDMTGLEHLHLRTMVVVVGLNVALNLCLIPLLGMNGAAAATGMSILVARGTLGYLVRSRRGLRPGALGY
jgi:O-antigen/teichoic acid export membrane protein